MTDSHKDRAHARLSASGAHRWINCPASPAIEDLFPDEESEAAAEGTLAHEFAEIEQKNYLGLIDSLKYNSRLAELRSHDLYSDGMEDYVAQYVEFVLGFYHEAKSQNLNPEIYIEQRLDLSEFIPESFGTSDNILFVDTTLHIFDLKFGYMPVDSTDNDQLRIYALGAWSLAKKQGREITQIFAHIVQPRINNFSTTEIDPQELADWAEFELKFYAERTVGSTEQIAGKHCQYCNGAHSCAVLAHEATDELENLKTESDYNLLTIEEKTSLYLKLPLFSLWADAFAAHMTQTARGGVKYDGLKLVEGTTRRTFSDAGKVLQTLIDLGYDRELLIEEKILSLGKMEKFLGKQETAKTIGSLIIKPRGKVILTSESDKRSAYVEHTPENDFNEPLDPEE